MIIFEWSSYSLFLISLILSIYAQIKISTAFRKYSSFYTASGRIASEVAREMLDSEGLYDVKISRVRGSLSDHYNPKDRTLYLSDTVVSSTSAAAIGVAAHEAGHAIQHARGYIPLKLRMTLVPITNFASRSSWIIILIGVLLSAFAAMSDVGYYVLLGGVGLFGVTTLFQLVTLPCEFNASRRALAYISDSGYYTKDELYASKKVLSAAAFTYVAAALVSVLQLLRFVIIFLGGRRRR